MHFLYPCLSMLGLVVVVLLIVLAKRLGHEWEAAGKFLGPAAALFLGALAVVPVPLLDKDPHSASETVILVSTWAGAVGWILVVLGAGIMASSDRNA